MSESSESAGGTTARVLRLLDLLQSRPVWSGTELAERLGVTTRSVRRDVERLRDLGYPLNAEHGAGGGYQLGAGRRLPPLLLDDDEAVAVAVCLRLAAGGTVEGLGEAAVRTLAKLDQVLPGRLRAQVEAIHEATVTLDSSGPIVDARTLLLLARACRATEQVAFGYAGPRGPSERRVEPYRLVATGRRWYLVAFDRDRDDWRTFRLDRIERARGRGWRFRQREAPDAAEFVRRAISQSAYDHVARVRIAAPRSVVVQRIPSSVGTVTADGPDHCIFEAGGNDLDAMAMHIGALPWELELLDPPELREAMLRQAERLARAAAGLSSTDRRTHAARMGT
ncbi:transcriptional regulator [Intrasporangium oryzae NRRL B-24470]|uniref:Transcriptional regulator n=1 Tax=Intrasporangium oryzae NRRL B-24470 TaxID=1386089 RepID=W9G9T3_9MICO|nr:YafY family protein [Intrasporangium oryzae]EWT01573.1 transcriptional regulator [Intrasporangium oryzae NRRL B-24470]